jgi:hypothetical protein
MAEYTIFPYRSSHACFSVGAFTYDTTPPLQVRSSYSTWEDWAEGDDADYMREWLTLGRGNSHTSDYHIYGPMRMYFGFQIYGERTSWGTLREPTHLWLTYRYSNMGDEREPAKDSLQLYYCPWGNGLDLRNITDYRALWHVADHGLVAPASQPFPYLSRRHAQFESVAIQLINTQHVVLGGPTWLIALSSAERTKPPLLYEPGVYCSSHVVGDPLACPFGYTDSDNYQLAARFISTKDGYGRAYWPKIVVGGQGTERTVTPLVPGPPRSRGGKPGSGHRTRL